MHADLLTGQTLTTVHDKSSAWYGLGSALTSLYQQTKFRSSLVGVASIVVYLFCVFVLHITIPSMFSVEPYNATIAMTVKTELFNVSLDLL